MFSSNQKSAGVIRASFAAAVIAVLLLITQGIFNSYERRKLLPPTMA